MTAAQAAHRQNAEAGYFHPASVFFAHVVRCPDHAVRRNGQSRQNRQPRRFRSPSPQNHWNLRSWRN